ncbi:hypothetical protein C1645_840332 [Glomus cerebriforme]|uniref:Uncharacterized protein n=1 Tax=Glomus cerebriforme TaxID=658196 RepID=A0A397S4E0_9GLOM|nr:hypothetical protein C1645_840332 [Glomus cerebriforme]
MKYGIHFNNNNANENILATLEEVDNIFFVENLSSDSKENISDSEETTSDSSNHEDNNDIDNLNENFNEMHLITLNFGKCSCSPNCYEKIGYEQFLACRMEFESLNKNMHDMVIKEQLLAFQQDENTKKVKTNNRKFLHFKYCFNNSLVICRNTYQNLTGIGYTYLDTIIKHF